MDHSVHHLGDTETVTEVMEWIISVILLDTQLKCKQFEIGNSR